MTPLLPASHPTLTRPGSVEGQWSCRPPWDGKDRRLASVRTGSRPGDGACAVSFAQVVDGERGFRGLERAGAFASSRPLAPERLTVTPAEGLATSDRE